MLVWLLTTCKSFPVITDQIWILKSIVEAAQTNSEEESIAIQPNWVGWEETKVLKLRYLFKSKLRQVPSSEEVTTNWLVKLISIPVIEEVCSVKVTKQNPDWLFQTLT